MQKLKLAVVASVLGEDARDWARLARVHGFDGLQIDASSAGITSLSHTGRREFARLFTAQDRQLVGLRIDVGPRGLGPGSDVDRILHGLNQVMETAAGLSMPLVCVELGPLPEAPAPVKPKPAIAAGMAGLILLPESKPEPPAPVAIAADPAFVSLVDGALAELGAAADRYGTMVALGSSLSSFAALERALKQASCPWFGVDLDPVAILRDAWDIDEVFSRLGQSIRHVRGRDATRGADRRTAPAIVGQGSTRWGDLLANLEAAGYSGWITLDSLEHANRLAAAIGGAEYLRKIRAGGDRMPGG